MSSMWTLSLRTPPLDYSDPRPDPVSNMRPVMYASPRRRPSNSPYSAAEFPSSMTGKEAAQGVREMEWTMMRQRVDMANHRFWVCSI